jgi:hypothetical protein
MIEIGFGFFFSILYESYVMCIVNIFIDSIEKN